MVNVTSKTCEADGCNKQPCYNIQGEIKGRFCASHKMPDMVNVRDKTCEVDRCNKQPTYNVRGEIKGLFCSEHKTNDMVNVTHKTCKFNGCEKQPVYNLRGETKGCFCVNHKTPEMVNVKDKTCEMNGCDTRPIYNIRGETKGRFCFQHKTPYMIDVKNKMCEFNECDKIPCYGWLGKGVSHCAPHKQKGMIRFPNRSCETTCCKQLGTHEANGTRYCEDHMPIGAENLGVETCSSCGLDDILTNGKCTTCDPSVVKMRQHAKENRIRDLYNVAGFQFVHDRMLEGPTCGRERPDFQFDCGTHWLYVEVDEHQHQSYACECEQGRMINLVHVRGMPVRWIRYNPDVYEPMKGQRKMTPAQREKKLIEYTLWAMKNPPDTFSEVIYLFYDEYDTKNQEWHTLI